MNSYLRCMLAVLLLLTATGCSSTGTTTVRALFVSVAEADALNERKLQVLSDEREMAGGLVVYFDTDSSAIDERYMPTLEYVGNYLVANPQTEVFIEGHTDDEGSPEQNVFLAQARADMIAYYIVKYGAMYDQVNTRAYGERYPAHEGSSQEDLRYNRRAVVEWAVQGAALGDDF